MCPVLWPEQSWSRAILEQAAWRVGHGTAAWERTAGLDAGPHL